VLSGLPSTLLTLAAGKDIFESTRAVGRFVLRRSQSDSSLFLAGGAAHVAISLCWGAILAAVLPRRRTALAGAVAGLAIAALDLGVVGCRLPTIRALDPVPQVLDHVAFGAVVGAALSWRDASTRR
jgi:hypothetical protein